MGSTRARIAIDAMGGDHAPEITGALRAREELGVEVLLVGDPRIKLLPQRTLLGQLEIVHLRKRLRCMRAVKRNQTQAKASINVAMDLVSSEAEAVVSAGHSGAAMAAGLLHLGRLRGIDRPAIGAVFRWLPVSQCWYLMSARMLIVVPSFGAVCRYGDDL